MAKTSPVQIAVAYGIVGIFALPFAGFGLFAGWMALQQAASPDPNWNQVAYSMMFALVFSGVGIGLLALLAFGRKKQKVIDAAKAAYPESPWMWRADWAQGRVLSKTKTSMELAWVLAIFWNLISWGIVYFAWSEIARQIQAKPISALVLIFPGVGIGILIYAVRETARWLEFGKTWFEMASVPGVIGRPLRGNIQARFPHGAAKGVTLKLSCVNRIVTGSGKSQSTQEKVLWRDEVTVPSGSLMPSPEGTYIPVKFEIPADALSTDDTDHRNQILWMVEAEADVPGVDYHDFFEIPVFRTKDSPAESQSVGRFNAFSHVPDGPVERPANPTIKVFPTANGTCFDFTPARNIGMALGTTAFFFVWSAIVWFLWGHAPIIFPIFFGLFDLILLFIVLSLWASSSIVTIGAGMVTIKAGLFGMGPMRTVSCAHVTDITLTVGMQSGGASGTPYYTINLICPERKIEAGTGVRSKLEAEWLVYEMKKSIGLKTQTEAAAAGV